MSNAGAVRMRSKIHADRFLNNSDRFNITIAGWSNSASLIPLHLNWKPLPVYRHDLRHTRASWHVQAGTSPNTLMEPGGWASYEMVLRYARLASIQLRDAAAVTDLAPGEGDSGKSVPVAIQLRCDVVQVPIKDKKHVTYCKWRRGWGSNPRGANAPNRFRVGAVMTTSVPLQKAKIDLVCA